MEHCEFANLKGNGERQDAIFKLLFEIRDLLRGPIAKQAAPKAEPPKQLEEDPLLDTTPLKTVVLKNIKQRRRK